MNNWPVTTSDLTYKNAACGKCRENSTTTPAQLTASCQSSLPPRRHHDTHSHLEEFAQRPDCSIQFKLPHNVQRLCHYIPANLTTVTQCLDPAADPVVARACLVFPLPFVVHVSSEGKEVHFNNIFCALCSYRVEDLYRLVFQYTF